MTKDEALRLALEALKQIDEAMPFPVAKLAQKVIKEALAQSEQEPVGEIVDAIEGAFKCSFTKMLPVGTKLYTTPPQRTWVGLTDGEVDKMILIMGFPPDWITENAIVKNIVRNLEAKLKEKNT